jgi:hypothetical protein
MSYGPKLWAIHAFALLFWMARLLVGTRALMALI